MARKQGAKSKEPLKPTESPQEMETLTKEKILELGEQAAQLLNSDVYNLAHQMAISQIENDWMGTSPKESLKRESLWHEAQAHGRAAQNLKALINAAQSQNLTDAQKAEQDLLRYENYQGFGLESQFDNH